MMVNGRSEVEISVNNEDFLCPVYQIYMRDPVKTKCQHIFERISLFGWLKRQETCPLCREKITKEDLILQIDLQKTIQIHLIDHPEEDDTVEYERIKREVLPSSPKEQVGQQKWQQTLHRTHQLAVFFFFISATTWAVSSYYCHDESTNPTSANGELIRSGSFYMTMASLGLTAATTKSVINRLRNLWRDQQERDYQD